RGQRMDGGVDASLARAAHAAIHALAAGAPLRLAGRALGASALAAGLCRAWRLPGLRLVWPG
ncbi:MAG TPA: hypothetical protein PKE47_15085, partial [Verrucomicrobiota bacterium]|nr:hypothetical protein [Verrucomicrobiota bacterium]